MPGGIDTFDATVSGSSANSYLTYEAADVLKNEYDCADAWDALDAQETRERLLLKATRLIDRYGRARGGWGPQKVDGQRLAFPRACDAAGVIPEGVVRAVMEIVNAELASDVGEIKRVQAEGVTSASILGANMSMTADESLIPAEARAELDILIAGDPGIQTIRPRLAGSEELSFFHED